MEIKENIIKKLQQIVKELTSEDIKIELSRPNDDNHGDYSSNVALRLSKILGKNPLEIAKGIAGKLGSSENIERVEAVAPGFINFYLAKEALIKVAEEAIQNPEKIIGVKNIGKNRKAIVEYSSPNIAKPFTIGHLRSTIIGDATANLLQAIGYEVYRDNHLGDWGTQFGKQIYAIKNIPLRDYPEGSAIEKMNEEELDKSANPVKDLVSLYVKFHEEAEKDTKLDDEARLWFKKLEEGDVEARRLWQKCVDWSWKEFDRIYKELGVEFTENNGRGYGEAYFEDKMQPVIDELKEKVLLKEDNGAQLVFFPEDKLPPLMIIKKDGATLYATRDLATDRFRLGRYGKDVLVVNEVGAEQTLYFRQLFETEYMLGWYKPGQRVHVGHGLYRFKEGKMSTRKGNTIWLEDVLEEAYKRAHALIAKTHDITFGDTYVKTKSLDKTPTLRESEIINISNEVSIGALKWNDLKRSSHLDVVFDWDEVLSMQGNSGPYVQYTYTRTQSVLQKVKSQNAKGKITFQFSYSPNEDEIRILRYVQKFPETVESAAVNYSPNIVTEYLFTLCQLFNNFYQKYRILNAQTEQEKQFRIALTATVGTVIKQGLNLLGIVAPERM